MGSDESNCGVIVKGKQCGYPSFSDQFSLM